ncbi:MAG: hypothetical protein AAFN81_22225 [Bacteroidota bacterium]
MLIRTLPLFLLFLAFSFNSLSAQNYLRINDPQGWWSPPSSEPGWEEYLPHGAFTDVDLVVSPQGIYTEIEVFATITAVEEMWSNELEIIWQFDLPAQAIVHDSWLWVEDDIIKADMIDYWTALAIYEDIVDRNQDPSFLYMLPDNRYEIRIFPLFYGDSRRIKMSFLIPAQWDEQKVAQDLLLNIFHSTDYSIGEATVAVVVDEAWGYPTLHLDGQTTLMDEIVVGGTGQQLHYLPLGPDNLYAAEEFWIEWDTPFNGPDQTFVHVYEDSGEQFYQLAYVPDWAQVLQSDEVEKRPLLLLDYQESKTDLERSEVANFVADQVLLHLNENDGINVGVNTSEGVQWLHANWWTVASGDLNAQIQDLLDLQDASDLEGLLSAAFQRIQEQGDVTRLFLIAANDDYVYPPIAEEAYTLLSDLIPAELPFQIIDYQNENVSVIYYEDETYSGNGYLYELLLQNLDNGSVTVLRDESLSMTEALTQWLPAPDAPMGIVDYSVNLENGLCYERFDLSTSELNSDNQGVLLQTGKYLGDFPMEIRGAFVTETNDFHSLELTIEPESVGTGDTLMREIWYAQHLTELFGQVSSNADREEIIDLSIQERILTPLTAFLALEPGLGGEPCIPCLSNDGTVIIDTSEEFDLAEASLTASPNPAVTFTTIRLEHPSGYDSRSLQAGIHDLHGRLIKVLDEPIRTAQYTEWEWLPTNDVPAGIYMCRLTDGQSESSIRIIRMD